MRAKVSRTKAETEAEVETEAEPECEGRRGSKGIKRIKIGSMEG